MVILFSLVFIFILLIMTSVVDVYLYRGRRFSVEIHLNLFALRLTRGKKRRKKRRLPIKLILKNYPYIKNALDRHLSISRVSLVDYDARLNVGGDLSAPPTLGRALALTVLSGYLKNRARSFSAITYPAPDGSSALTVIFSFRLFQLFISALFFLYYKVKGSKGRRKYV